VQWAPCSLLLACHHHCCLCVRVCVQGQFDVLDGVSSVSSWIDTIAWSGQEAFSALKGELWHSGEAGARVVGGCLSTCRAIACQLWSRFLCVHA
jgi:hypothetical protein